MSTFSEVLQARREDLNCNFIISKELKVRTLDPSFNLRPLNGNLNLQFGGRKDDKLFSELLQARK